MRRKNVWRIGKIIWKNVNCKLDVYWANAKCTCPPHARFVAYVRAVKKLVIYHKLVYVVFGE